MNDFISRQALLRWLKTYRFRANGSPKGVVKAVLGAVIGYVETTPSVGERHGFPSRDLLISRLRNTEKKDQSLEAGLAKEAADTIAELEAQVVQLSESLEKHVKAAQRIALCLDEFCDYSKPYTEMLADASKKAEDELILFRQKEYIRK